jgi:glutaredoxin 3
MNQVTIYTADPCARCGKAKALLMRHGIEFSEVNLSKDPDGRAELVQRTGLMTFPQIVIGSRTIGGLADLEQAEAEGRLPELVAVRP